MTLKTELAKRLLNDMILKSKGSDPAIVLVVDPHTSKILSSCLRVYDIMEAGVLVLQNVQLSRERLPDLPAIYFIEPTSENFERLKKDFEDPKKPHYLNAHLYFTQEVGKRQIGQISGAAFLKKVKSFIELNSDFLALESRVFTFDRPCTIPRLYFSTIDDTTPLSIELSALSRHLVTLCITLGEYPYVRYAQSKGAICKGLATWFESDMKKIISKLTDWKANDSRPRGTLLIVDRSLDPVAPLMHEYTFQAMVQDLLDVRGEIVTLPDQDTPAANAKKTEEKKAEEEEGKNEFVLSEDDHLWLEFRHSHIGKVMHDVTVKFKEFKGANKMAQLQQDGENTTVKDMIQAMKEMPAYKTMMKKYQKHMSLAQECMVKFDKQCLKDLGELEQDMATGLNADGKSVSVKDLKNKLVAMCQDPAVTVIDKLRLLMIFIISQGGIQDATRKELMKNVDIDLQEAIKNLEKLGVELSNMTSKKSKHSRERLAEFAQRNKEIPLALMRYLPSLHSVVEGLVSGELTDEKFPFTSPPPPDSAAAASGKERVGQSARKAKRGGSDWKSSEPAANTPQEDNRPRFIIFVLGGMTFSEMRSIYEIADKEKANIFLGSTSTLTPVDYIRDLSGLNDAQFQAAIARSQAASSRGSAASSSGAPMAASSNDKVRRPIAGGNDSDSDDDAIGMDKLAIKFDDKKTTTRK